VRYESSFVQRFPRRRPTADRRCFRLGNRKAAIAVVKPPLTADKPSNDGGSQAPHPCQRGVWFQTWSNANSSQRFKEEKLQNNGRQQNSKEAGNPEPDRTAIADLCNVVCWVDALAFCLFFLAGKPHIVSSDRRIPSEIVLKNSNFLSKLRKLFTKLSFLFVPWDNQQK